MPLAFASSTRSFGIFLFTIQLTAGYVNSSAYLVANKETRTFNSFDHAITSAFCSTVLSI